MTGQEKKSSATTTLRPAAGLAAPAERPAPVELDGLLGGACHDPHALLGAHPAGPDARCIRVLRPFAEGVRVVQADGQYELHEEGEGVFAGIVPGSPEEAYRLRVDYGETVLDQDDAYRFLPVPGDIDLQVIDGLRRLVLDQKARHAVAEHRGVFAAPDIDAIRRECS